jgi:hypothetical protein
MKPLRTILALLALILAPTFAVAQGALLQGGGATLGHAPMYITQGTGQTVVQDSGGAGGGGNGVGLSELGLTARGTGTAPFSGQGTGPLGTNFCDYDAPTNNPTGYHYLCFSPNASNGASTFTIGAAGGAANLPVDFVVNGTTYAFPGAFGSLIVGTTGITGGINGQCLYINSAVLGAQNCGAITITVGSTAISGGTPNGLLYNSGGFVGNLATAASSVLVTSSGSVPGLATTLPSGLTIPSPTVSGTIAGSPTLSGTWNFTGTFEIGAATQTFPGSGLLVGATDTQTLTNKSIAGSEINSGTVAGTYLAAINLATTGNGGISGTLGYANGGCSATSQTACTNNIFPTPVRTGDVAIWNGSLWTTLAGNNSGNVFFSENASGAASWQVASGSGTVTSATIAAGANVSVSGTCTFTTTGTCTVNAPGTNVDGDTRNLKIVRASTTTLTITADEIVTETALGGTTYKEYSASHTLTITNTGANGMDTGSPPTSGFICVYSITKGDNSTYAVLGVNAATNDCPTIYPGANIPSGYIASSLIAIWPTDGSVHVVAGTVLGRHYASQGWQLISNALTGSATLTSLSISSGVAPVSTKTVDLLIGPNANHSGNTVGAAGDGTGTGYVRGTSPSSTDSVIGVYGVTLFGVPVLTSQTIYWTEAGANTDSVYVLGYSW